MDYSKIQSKVYSGYGRAAKYVGRENKLYRPSTYADPITDYNLKARVNVSYNAEDMSYKRPNKYGHPTWYAVFDASQAKVGDYLDGPDGTYFIAAKQSLLPVLVVSCNRTATVMRPTQENSGAADYSSVATATETVLMQNYPCSILQGTKGERAESNLPASTRLAWWSILLPYKEGVTIKPADILLDDLKRKYFISSPELTDLGWRLTASIEVP